MLKFEISDAGWMRTSTKCVATLAMLLALERGVGAQTTWYVDASAPPLGNGTSWATAYDQLDLAIASASGGDQIWVAEGTYKPSVRESPRDPRSVSFDMTKLIRMYGGFAGYETSLSTRAGLFSTTILDGDVGIPGVETDNAYHVITAEHGEVIDGFTIRNGNADGTQGEEGRGGAIHFAITNHPPAPVLTLSNCTLVHNHANQGGALWGQAGYVFAKRCTFKLNTAQSGGAIAGNFLMGLVSNCFLIHNSATNSGGAVVMNVGGVPFQNCVFFGNSAMSGGAAYLSGLNNPILVAARGRWFNCTFTRNSASISGGAIFTDSGAPSPATNRVENCIVWGNIAPADPELAGIQTVSFSDVRGGAIGTANIQGDPLFAHPSSWRLQLLPGSPAIDAGNNDSVRMDSTDLDADGNYSELTPLDVVGNARFQDDPGTPDTGCCSSPIVDMGAYEHP